MLVLIDESGDPGFRIAQGSTVVDKAAVQSPHLRTVTDNFYNYFLRLVLQHDGGAMQGASIKIDGSGDAKFKRELTSYLRQQLRDGQIGKFTFVDSKKGSLVQLADMCSGAILRAYRNDLRQNDTWLSVLRKARRIENIWKFR